jgi:hypothetical protein
MKYNWLAILLLLTALAFEGCSNTSLVNSNNNLTNERVQRTINQWANGDSATVTGIQEFPSENRAVATLTFTSLKTAPYHRTDMQDPSTSYSGPAEAKLIHYNDGRWVVTEISSLPSHTLRFDNVNLEVK